MERVYEFLYGLLTDFIIICWELGLIVIFVVAVMAALPTMVKKVLSEEVNSWHHYRRQRKAISDIMKQSLSDLEGELGGHVAFLEYLCEVARKKGLQHFSSSDSGSPTGCPDPGADS